MLKRFFSDWYEGRKYYAVLLLWCLAAFVVIALPNFLDGKSIIWKADGYDLYLNFFVLEGEAIRSFFEGLFSGNVPELSTYAFAAGYGADLLLTAGGCFNDPFNIVSALLPVSWAEYGYEFLIFVRFYLAAAAFSFFCFSRGNKGWPVLLASLAYVLSGFVVFWGVMRHANFLNIAILLPLLFAGADRIFAGEKPFLLVIPLALSFVFSVYFTYMLLIVLFVYCLVKYFLGEREGKGARDFFLLLGKFILCIVLSALMSAIVVIPEVLLLTSMGRVGLERADVLLYSCAYYLNLPMAMAGYSSSARSAGIGVVSLLALVAFVFNGREMGLKKEFPWLVAILLCVVGALLPFVGKAMNGFSYTTDRWMVVWSFCSAYILCLVAPSIGSMDVLRGKRAKVVIAALFAFVLFAALYQRSEHAIATLVLFLVGVVLVIVLGRYRFGQVAACCSLSILMVASVGAASLCTFSSSGEGKSSQFADFGGYAAAVKSNPATLLEDIVGENWRYDQQSALCFRNASLSAGVKGVDFYSSFYNQVVDDFRQEMGLSDGNINYQFIGSDSRLALEALSAAKYYLARCGVTQLVPDGYVLKEKLGEYDLYETDNVLPLGFVYQNKISREAFDALGPLEKQETLLRGVVLERDEDQPQDAELFRSGGSSLQEVGILEQEKLKLTEYGVKTTGKNAKLTIENNYSDVEGEKYLIISGLKFSPLRPWSLSAIAEEESSPKAVRMLLDSVMWSKPDKAKVIISDGENKRSVNVTTNESTAYAGKENWVINLGDIGDSEKITITFSTKGKYSFDYVGVGVQDTDVLIDDISRLKSNGTVDCHLGANSVDAQAETKVDDGFVYFSLPYSSGWKAELDGEPVALEKANVGFMAVEVPEKGSHQIKLTYETPGLKLGAIGSLIGLVTLLMVALFYSRKEKNDRYRGW